MRVVRVLSIGVLVLIAPLVGCSSSSSATLPCSKVFRGGRPTTDLIDPPACVPRAGGNPVLVASVVWDCRQGDKLYSNDYGWGRTSSTWHAGPYVKTPTILICTQG